MGAGAASGLGAPSASDLELMSWHDYLSREPLEAFPALGQIDWRRAGISRAAAAPTMRARSSRSKAILFSSMRRLLSSASTVSAEISQQEEARRRLTRMRSSMNSRRVVTAF